MKRNNQSRNGNGLRFRPFLFGLILVILLTFLCSRYVVQLLLIKGRSMEPTYHNWEFALIDRRDRSFSTGDVAAVRCEGLHTLIVKRIAAAEGDRAVIVNGTLMVNGQPSPLYPEGIFSVPGLLEQEQVLEEGCFLILGDNIEESVDSRDERVGVIRQEDIVGKIIPQRDSAGK